MCVSPGSISSTDDFFQMSSGLVVMETTNSVFNGSLYNGIIPQTLLSWTRAVVAGTLARSGPEWANLFAQHNRCEACVCVCSSRASV